jgi:hypothetical protein
MSFVHTVLNKTLTQRMFVFRVTKSSSKINISDWISVVTPSYFFSINSLRNYVNITCYVLSLWHI